jgi:hypothetical protein
MARQPSDAPEDLPKQAPRQVALGKLEGDAQIWAPTQTGGKISAVNLRHTFASLLLAQRAPITYVSASAAC